MKCDLCEKEDYRIVYDQLIDSISLKAEFFQLVMCNNCHLVSLSPKPDAQTLRSYYTSEYQPYKKDRGIYLLLKQLLWRMDKHFIKRLIGSTGSVLEIGCDQGEYLHALGNQYDRLGIEMDAGCVEKGKQRFKLDLREGTLEDFTFSPQKKFNLIIMRHVLEHLSSPEMALKKLKSLLAPGGTALISTPNFNSIERMLFGRYWHSLDIPRHLFIFTPKTFASYLQKNGFQIICLKYSSVPNDWIGSIRRWCNVKGFRWLSLFFDIKNFSLIFFFFPFSFITSILKKSSRITFAIKPIEK